MLKGLRQKSQSIYHLILLEYNIHAQIYDIKYLLNSQSHITFKQEDKVGKVKT